MNETGTRVDMYEVLNQEMAGIRDANHELERLHRQRVESSEVQYGMGLRESFREFFRQHRDQLPRAFGGVDPSCDLDVRRCAFLKVGSHDVIENDEAQAELFFEHRSELFGAVRNAILRNLSTVSR